MRSGNRETNLSHANRAVEGERIAVMNNFAYEENFYTENKETKEALKELTACHHMVYVFLHLVFL